MTRQHKLVAMRKERHITQAQMAQLLGISTTAYLMKEQGKTDFKLSEMQEIGRGSRSVPPEVSEVSFSSIEMLQAKEGPSRERRGAFFVKATPEKNRPTDWGERCICERQVKCNI